MRDGIRSSSMIMASTRPPHLPIFAAFLIMAVMTARADESATTSDGGALVASLNDLRIGGEAGGEVVAAAIDIVEAERRTLERRLAKMKLLG